MAADGGSSLLASESFSPTGGLVGTQTLEGEAGGSGAAAAAAAAAQGEAEEQVRIDFASIDARSRELGGKGEQEALGGIEEVDRALEGMAPNMKALQQYDEVQARLHRMEANPNPYPNPTPSLTLTPTLTPTPTPSPSLSLTLTLSLTLPLTLTRRGCTAWRGCAKPRALRR